MAERAIDHSDDNLANLTLRVPPSLKADLIAISQREFGSVSALVRRLLADGIMRDRRAHRRFAKAAPNGQ